MIQTRWLFTCPETPKLHRVTGWLFALLILSACSNPIGTEYRDVDALAMAPEWDEWVVVGSFGASGPFVLVETKFCEANLPCNFSHSGQGHTYSGFDDFELMVLRLESSEGEVAHVVLRGADPV